MYLLTYLFKHPLPLPGRQLEPEDLWWCSICCFLPEPTVMNNHSILSGPALGIDCTAILSVALRTLSPVVMCWLVGLIVWLLTT